MNKPGEHLDLPFLPRRIVAARVATKKTQETLAAEIGFGDRQTLAAIESGQRRVKADELAKIAEATGCSMDFFLDPFRLVSEEAAFSYRAKSADVSDLDALEESAGRMISLWRYLGTKSRRDPGFLRQSLSLDEGSSYEDAQAAGEAVCRELNLGEVPANELMLRITEHLRILVIHLDLPSGVSGVAARVTNSDTIIVNRREAPTRRAFDLAHELFHVLTWDKLPPERVDRANPEGYKQKKQEQLADNFAGALLMPAAAISELWRNKPANSDLAEWIRSASKHFGVSREAVFWRLVALRLVRKNEKPNFEGPSGTAVAAPPLFSRSFLERITWGLDNGELSLRRVIEILGLRGESALRALYLQHGLPPPADL